MVGGIKLGQFLEFACKDWEITATLKVKVIPVKHDTAGKI